MIFSPLSEVVWGRVRDSETCTTSFIFRNLRKRLIIIHGQKNEEKEKKDEENDGGIW